MRYWLLCCAILLTAPAAHAGKLRNASSAARGGGSSSNDSSSSRNQPPPSSRDSHGSGSYYDSGTSSAEGAFYGFLMWQALRFPILIPQLALESRGQLPFIYEPKPYAKRAKGIVRTQKLLETNQELVLLSAETYMVSDGPPGERSWMPGELVHEDAEQLAYADAPEQSAEAYEQTYDPPYELTGMAPEQPAAPPPPFDDGSWTEGGQRWASQLSLDAASIGDGTVRLRPHFRLFTPSRWELSADAAIYREELHGDDAQAKGRNVDYLTMSTIHGAYRFAQSQAVQFRLGFGPRLMTTPDAAFMGWDLSYGFDAFPVKPVILSGSLGIGTVGKAFVTDLRGSIGVIISAVEIMVGGERIAIGDVVLAGPTAGVRIWF